MNRENGLFLLVGLLAGFLVGYLAHEAMSGVQPPRLATTVGPGAGDPHAGVDGAPGSQPMPDLNRLRDVLEQDPENRQALISLANMYFDIGSWARAQELYERFLRLEPDNPDVLTDLGIALRSQGQLDSALEKFRRAQQIDAAHWQSVYNEVVVHAFDRADFATAETVLAELRRRAGESPEVQRLAEEIARRRSAP